MEVDWPDGIDGLRALFRLGFQSMRVPDLPSSMTVANVLFVTTEGPVTTRRTTVVQRPAAPLVWDKTRHVFPDLPVPDGVQPT